MRERGVDGTAQNGTSLKQLIRSPLPRETITLCENVIVYKTKRGRFVLNTRRPKPEKSFVYVISSPLFEFSQKGEI